MSRQKTEAVPFQQDVLSDHAYRSMRFTRYAVHGGALLGQVNVGTWNLLDQCHSAEDNPRVAFAAKEIDRLQTHLETQQRALAETPETDLRARKFRTDRVEEARRQLEKARSRHAEYLRTAYPNNPYNITENDARYAARKRRQMTRIYERLEAGEDILCLQEVDFYTVIQPKPIHEALRAEFEAGLGARGYAALRCSGRDNEGTRYQKLVTLYNDRKFIPESARGVLRTADSWRGYETRFRLRDNPSQTLTVTNVHLTFGEDYRQTLPAYQQTFEDRSEFHILAGDTNNIPGEHLPETFGSGHGEATNFDWNPETQRLTTVHRSAATAVRPILGAQKEYDIHAAVAPKGQRVATVPNTDRNERFLIDQDGRVRIALFKNERVSRAGHEASSSTRPYGPAPARLQPPHREIRRAFAPPRQRASCTPSARGYNASRLPEASPPFRVFTLTGVVSGVAGPALLAVGLLAIFPPAGLGLAGAIGIIAGVAIIGGVIGAAAGAYIDSRRAEEKQASSFSRMAAEMPGSKGQSAASVSMQPDPLVRWSPVNARKRKQSESLGSYPGITQTP